MRHPESRMQGAVRPLGENHGEDAVECVRPCPGVDGVRARSGAECLVLDRVPDRRPRLEASAVQRGSPAEMDPAPRPGIPRVHGDGLGSAGGRRDEVCRVRQGQRRGSAQPVADPVEGVVGVVAPEQVVVVVARRHGVVDVEQAHGPRDRRVHAREEEPLHGRDRDGRRGGQRIGAGEQRYLAGKSCEQVVHRREIAGRPWRAARPVELGDLRGQHPRARRRPAGHGGEGPRDQRP